MSRQPRLNIAGGIYHVMNRGNRKLPIFEDEGDRRKFLQILVEEQEIYGVRTLGGCLMSNHFHDVVHTPHANLSEFMEQLEGRFARYSNWQHSRVGHLFQGRFRSVLIESDIHLLTALCYVFMNPVAAGLANTLEGFKWSTYASTVGLSATPKYLTTDWLLAFFPGGSLSEAQDDFSKLMNTAQPIATYIESEFSVRPDDVKEVIRSYTGEQFSAARLPHAYRTLLRPALHELRLDHGDDVTAFVRRARVLYGYKCAEIANCLRVHPCTVSKIFRGHQRQRSVPAKKSAAVG